MVGGELDIIDGNFRIGNSEYFLTEACEYKRSFLKFFPYVGVILNIDADHLDCYKDINEIAETFEKFSNLIPDDGYLVGYGEDPRVKNIINKAKCNTLSYGFENADVTARNVNFNKMGCASFDVYKDDENLFSVSLSVPGKHNVLNALATICVSLIFNITYDSIASGLSKCKGAHKRFEYKGEFNGVTVIDDYAHHPTEIKATLSTAKKIDHNKIYCVFQPHTYTRTKSLLNEFAEAFYSADKVIITDIYAARENDPGDIHSKDLVEKLYQNHVDATYISNFEDITEYLRKHVQNNDLVITAGAGPIFKVAEALVEEK